MKAAIWILAMSLACLLGTLGCKREQPPVTQDRYKTGVDWPKLDAEFSNNSDPDVIASVASIKRAILYRQFPQAMVELDRFSNNPKLNDPQKKLINELIDQTKQVMSKAPPQPGQ